MCHSIMNMLSPITILWTASGSYDCECIRAFSYIVAVQKWISLLFLSNPSFGLWHVFIAGWYKHRLDWNTGLTVFTHVLVG